MTVESLDYYVMKTLESLEGWSYPRLPLKKTGRNLFIGSGNAFNVGIVFAKKFGGNICTTANYQEYLENADPSDFSSVNIISASGGKDSVNMARFLKQKGFDFNLITCNEEPPAGEFLPKERIFVFPSFTEPPTYNVSTYTSMIYSLFPEKIEGIKTKIKGLEIPDLRKYKFIFFVSDDRHEPAAIMAGRKVGESLAGIGSHGEGISTARHGMLIHENPDRLDFCMDCDTETSNVYRLNAGSLLGSLMCAYYIIGKNQRPSDMKGIEKSYSSIAKKSGWKFNKVW